MERSTRIRPDPRAKSTALAVIGAAGYGVSTVLMSIAAQIAKKKIGHVFGDRATADVLEADVALAGARLHKGANRRKRDGTLPFCA